MPLQATSGAASYDAFGGGVAAVPNYIESCFSTWLYTGNGSTQTITNGIDLSGKGGLVWLKARNQAYDHTLIDTVRGSNKVLYSNATVAQATNANVISAFTSSGFTEPGTSAYSGENGTNYASWTFRKQPKFFDIVTYTGNGTGQTINHNLGSVPGCIIIKATGGGASSGVTNWAVYHRSLGNTDFAWLNSTAAKLTSSGYWNNTTPTSTQFTVGSTGNVNESGASFVAYLFAHNAGGFGLTGTDNVISCGSYTGTGSAQDINLGYEPQFLIIKNATTGGTNWVMLDNMRGLPVGTGDAYLKPNLSDAEVATSDFVDPTATGFRTILSTMNTSGNTFIYIAIRRGPMKVPTSGTSVFEPVTTTAANFVKTTLEAVDMGIFKDAALTSNFFVSDRLRGIMSYYNPTLYTNLTNAEATPTTGDTITSTSSEGTGNGKFYFGGAGSGTDKPTGYAFKRAPSFFDEVCYTGTGATIALNHNLAAVPELMIVKSRGAATGNWVTYTATYGSGSFIRLNSTSGNNTGAGNLWGATTPTSSLFYVGEGGAGGLSVSANNYVAYLFATCAGVSKVGSYTGNGTTQTINCGFTGGARFVLIKRTDTTGDWYVWDTARGMVSGTDPSLLLNSTAAEVNANSIYTTTGGFQIVSTAAGINASGGNYIFLAIA